MVSMAERPLLPNCAARMIWFASEGSADSVNGVCVFAAARSASLAVAKDADAERLLPREAVGAAEETMCGTPLIATALASACSGLLVLDDCAAPRVLRAASCPLLELYAAVLLLPVAADVFVFVAFLFEFA